MSKYDYLEGETLQNIQFLLEEKDLVIKELKEACKEALTEWRLHGALTDTARKIEQAISKAKEK
jgi:hypothetical protein